MYLCKRIRETHFFDDYGGFLAGLVRHVMDLLGTFEIFNERNHIL